MEQIKILPSNKKLILEVSIFALLLAISLIFPICNFYYEGETDLIIKPQYLWDFELAYVFPVNFVLIALGVLSLKKIALQVMNILVILISLFTYFIMIMGFAWWGASPFHPSFEYGFFLSQLVLLAFLVRSYFWIKHFDQLRVMNKSAKVFVALAIAVPLILVALIVSAIYIDSQQPIMRSEWYPKPENGRKQRVVYWDYPAYNAYVSAYMSRDEKADENTPYQLDSAHFRYFNDQSDEIKSFTKKAKNHTLDFEQILDDNE